MAASFFRLLNVTACRCFAKYLKSNQLLNKRNEIIEMADAKTNY